MEEKKDGTTTFTTYDSYNGNGLPLKISTISSSNDNLITTFKYPTDFSSTVYNGMKSANIVTPIIEKSTYKGSKFLGKEISNYYMWNSKFYVQENSQIQYENGETDIRLKFDYDKRGNYRMIIKDDRERVIYLWSYNGQYPIAEIKDASLSEVETAIRTVFSATSIDALSLLTTPNEAKLKDGSLQKALPNAIVSTYTYKPLIGILTATDPSGITTYYTYDSFGRLKEAYIYKDNVLSAANKQIVQSYDYHYQNQ